MNKEVIYLEPEDDITDILTKLQQAEQKLVALVPPKKATILHSAINVKLVARVAKECEKVVVLVTADPAIVKMAMIARVPVAKNLQSRPVIPTAANTPDKIEEITSADDIEVKPESEPDTTSDTAEKPAEKPSKFSLFKKNKAEKAPETPSKAASGPLEPSSDKSAEDIVLEDNDLETPSKDAKKAKNKSGKPFFVRNLKKILLIGIPAIAVITIALVWAFVFAPAAEITVAISSSSTNLAENVSFTTDPEAAKPAEGIFLVETEKLEQKYSEEFTIEKEEDRGKHAKGNVSISTRISTLANPSGLSISVPKGTILSTASGLEYEMLDEVNLGWSGTFPITCDTGPVSTNTSNCVQTVTIEVEAVEPGESSNLLTSVIWSPYQGLTITNGQITGGTTEMVKVVSKDAVEKVAKDLLEKHSDEGKKMLLEDIPADKVAIESSFKGENTETTSTPEIDAVLDDESTTKPTVNTTVTYSVYTISKSQIEEYVKAKLNIADDQRLYSIGKPYFERFTSLEESARLKTVIETGPIISEDLIFDKAAGRKTGEVQSILRSIGGISSVDIKTSYFWVWSIPTDRDRVTINIEAEGDK